MLKLKYTQQLGQPEEYEIQSEMDLFVEQTDDMVVNRDRVDKLTEIIRLTVT